MKTQRFQTLLAVLTSLAAAGLISAELQEKARNKKVSTSPLSIKYISKNIGKGGGTIDLVDSNTKELVGVSNFRSNRLDTGNVFIFDKIRVLRGFHASETDPSKIRYDVFISEENLKNSEIEIYTNGKKVLNLPLSSILLKQNDTGKDGYELVTPGYLLDNAEFEIKLKMPHVFSGTNNYFIRVELEGIETLV